MDISEFQRLMKDLYYTNDAQRGVHRTGLWLMEEMGELSHELKKFLPAINLKAVAEEMADIYAWVASLANLLDIDLSEAVLSKYPYKCIKCNQNPCMCKKNVG